MLLSIRESENRTAEALKMLKQAIDDFEISGGAGQADRPIVSVIIPAYEHATLTFACLASLFWSYPQTPFEVIIADDCSPSGDYDVADGLSRYIRVIKPETNLGFLKNCNNAAKSASGRFIVLLNNDMVVFPNWLDSLINTISNQVGCGIVGSKIVNFEGGLQEAGGIIWRDGSAWQYGNGGDPQAPEFNYRKEVDYCSGASLCITKTVWEKLGGFDERYSPAYCEDSDLAMAVRDLGLSVIYEPQSVGIHLEGASCGSDVTNGIKAFQVINQKKFLRKWSRKLCSDHHVSGERVLFARDRTSHKRRVLFVDECTPTPDRDAGSVTALNIMLLFRAMDFHITFVPIDNLAFIPEYTPLLQTHGIEALYFTNREAFEEYLSEHGKFYDLIFVCRPVPAKTICEIQSEWMAQARIIYHTIDLHFLRMERAAALSGENQALVAAAEMKRLECELIRSVDAAIVHSTAELETLQPLVPTDNIHVFPLILSVAETHQSFKDRSDIVFVGGFAHPPNADAVEFFIREVMPILRKRLRGVRFHVVGNNPPESITQLACADVIIRGFVPELRPLLDEMRVSVAPLRYGAGVKGKIGTAMAAGLPVVASSIAAEGMGLSAGSNVLLADEPPDLVEAIASVYENEELWYALSRNATRFASEVWGPEAAWNKLASIVGNFLHDVGPAPVDLQLYSESRKAN
jgi:GT2 family glycosyltransferase